MRIEIQAASNLGPIYQQPGLKADSRVSIGQPDTDGRLAVWDLISGRYFEISSLPNPQAVEESFVEVPAWVKTMIETPNDELLAKYNSSWLEGGTEIHTAMLTELTFRGVKVR